MKNLFIATFTIVALGLVFSVSSCKKIDNPTAIDTIDSSKTATITCVAQAQLIDTFPIVGGNVTPNEFESVPNGTVVTAWVSSADYPGVGAAGQDLNWSTTVTNGSFSFEIPVPDDGITVTVVPQDFRADYITNGPNVDEDEIFAASSFTVFLRPDQAEILDITWSN